MAFCLPIVSNLSDSKDLNKEKKGNEYKKVFIRFCAFGHFDRMRTQASGFDCNSCI